MRPPRLPSPPNGQTPSAEHGRARRRNVPTGKVQTSLEPALPLICTPPSGISSRPGSRTTQH
eukprot:11227272-Alexandrium_andersonii.AAC.1